MKLFKFLIPAAVLLIGLALVFVIFSPISNAHQAIPITGNTTEQIETIVAVGDIATCGSDGASETAKLLDTITGTIIALGDYAYESGSMTEFMQCYDPFWGKFKSRMHPSAGNHEYGTQNAQDYFRYFGNAAGDPSKGYYSFDLGAWHIIALNSNCDKIGGCGADSAQEQWLKSDLAAHHSVCTLAYWHHPRFSSGEHGSTKAMDTFWRDLYAAGVDVVLNGHDHDYERFAPQNPDEQLDLNGVREIIVGTGGASHYQLKTPISHSRLYNVETFGVLQMHLYPTRYDWQFIPVEGKTFSDSGSALCSGAQPSAYMGAVLSDKPASYWRLDDTRASMAHDTMEQNDGRFNRSITLGAAGAVKDDSALNFAGKDGYISVPNDPLLNIKNDMTLEAWAKPTALDGTTHIIVEKGEGSVANNAQYRLALHSTNHWQGCVYIGGQERCLESRDEASTTTWTHLVLTRSGDTLTLYVNGASVATTKAVGAINTTDLMFAIGRAGSESTRYFDGGIDEVALYDHALTLERVRAHFEAAAK